MKKILLLFFALLCVSAVSAQTVSNTLIVESKNGEKFYLKVDGFRRNSVPSGRVEVKGIYASKARISVIFEDSLYVPIRNYEVILVPEKKRNEVRPMSGFVSTYLIVAGKNKSKAKKVRSVSVNAIPVYKPVPVPYN
ncbi:MAG: hypothetical protein KBT40_03095 [bacterium]|nr:hypothetical protein [Candidatus Minthenecus merdequi]